MRWQHVQYKMQELKRALPLTRTSFGTSNSRHACCQLSYMRFPDYTMGEACSAANLMALGSVPRPCDTRSMHRCQLNDVGSWCIRSENHVSLPTRWRSVLRASNSRSLSAVNFHDICSPEHPKTRSMHRWQNANPSGADSPSCKNTQARLSKPCAPRALVKTSVLQAALMGSQLAKCMLPQVSRHFCNKPAEIQARNTMMSQESVIPFMTPEGYALFGPCFMKEQGGCVHT